MDATYPIDLQNNHPSDVQPTRKSNRARKSTMAPATLEGYTLGKYRVLEPLGRGGMAQVYKAYHPQLERYVAIKVLRSDLVEEEEFLARFRREARSVAGLRHPNIVQVYDFDVQDDIYYMVMELLEGDTLKASLNSYRNRNQPMPYSQTLRVLLDVLAGLAYAHKEGIIHRDIKPANVLLTRKGEAVLTDFGIAQIIGGTRYTLSGALMGTLHYMSPEQGLQGHGDIRSDLYSLGIVFYEMLTGRPPFDADTPLAILMKHVNDPLPLPHILNPEIPEPFERVLLKVLAKQPDDRYQSADEMAQGLTVAAQEAEVEVAESVQPFFSGRSGTGSLPGATTAIAGADAGSVAVFSGPTRQNLGEASFAADDTDDHLSEQLKIAQASMPAGASALTSTSAGTDADAKSPTEQLGAAAGAFATALAGTLNVAAAAIKNAVEDEKVQGNPTTARFTTQVNEAAQTIKIALEAESAQGFPTANRLVGQVKESLLADETLGEATPRPKPGHMSHLFAGLSALVVGNVLIAGILTLTGGWGLFSYIWPIELLLISFFFGQLMIWLSIPWLLIPGGIVLGNGLLLAFFTITGRWGSWLLMWPLEPVIVFASIWLALRLDKRTHGSEAGWIESRQAGRAITLFSLLGIPVIAALGMLAAALHQIIP